MRVGAGALRGAFPVLPTPFDASGAINAEDFDRVIDFALASGADGVVFPGLASEYDELSMDERLALIERAGERVAGRAPFVVGASDPDPERSAALVAAGKRAGADVAMVMTPRAFDGDAGRLTRFYAELGDAGLPIMLQNAPRPMGLGLDAAEVAAVAEAAPAIAYVKEENMPCGQRITALLDRARGLAGVFGGAGGRYIVDEMRRGAVGTMPAAELADMHVRLVRRFAAGDEAGARDLYEAMLPILLMQAVFRWDLTKQALRARGVIRSTGVRAAGPRMDAADLDEMNRLLERLPAVAGEPARAAAR